MFTGLIEAVCTVKSVRQRAGGFVLTVDLDRLANDSKIGDSVAISGACLTISELQGNLAIFELSAETLTKSTLGKLRPSSKVNVERALKATDRFGGHFVQGHIDGTATIKVIKRRGQFADIRFAADPDLLSQMLVKGSLAVDGVSLTITDINENSFGTALIPQTLKNTTLGTAKPGDIVNVETDIIIKAMKKELEKILPQEQTLTAERLRYLGF